MAENTDRDGRKLRRAYRLRPDIYDALVSTSRQYGVTMTALIEEAVESSYMSDTDRRTRFCRRIKERGNGAGA